MYLLWLAVGKSNFLQNNLEEIRRGCRNLQKSLIMVHLLEIFLGGMMLKVQAGVCVFKDIGWARISSIDMGEGSCYWLDVAKYKVIE